MGRFIACLSLILMLLETTKAGGAKPFVSGEVLMKFRLGENQKFRMVNDRIVSGDTILDQYLHAVGARSFTDIFSAASDLRGHYKLKFPSDVDVEEICRTLRLSGAIEYATPNYVARTSSDPNDPLWPQQWQGTKQQFNKAWDLTRGSSVVSVGIIDVGLDISHPDISPNAHPSLHRDFVDDDFDPSEEPPSDHGTRVGGIVSARPDNGIGLAGYTGGWGSTQGCPVVGLRVGFYDPATEGDRIPQEWAAQAIDHARMNGIRVVNMSFNYYQAFDTELPLLKAAVDAAKNTVVIVVSSGNGFKNDDSVNPNQPLPAPGRWSGVIAVGASLYGSTLSGELRWNGSNYTNVDNALSVVASVGQEGVSPGTHQTAQQGGTYSTIGRTSAAAPQVTALAALILSVNNSLTPAQVKSIIESTTEKIGPYTYTNGRTAEVGYGRINAYKALTHTLRLHGGTISGNLTIPSGETWTLSPGITWTFTGNYKLRVEGKLVANGTSSQPITFTSSGGQWYGIEFYNGQTGSSIQYASIQNAQYGVFLYNTNAPVTNSTIQYNTTGVYMSGTSSTLNWNRIQNNTYGVQCASYGHANIQPNNVLRYNDWGVYGDATSVPELGNFPGYNSLYGNSFFDAYSTYPGTI